MLGKNKCSHPVTGKENATAMGKIYNLAKALHSWPMHIAIHIGMFFSVSIVCPLNQEDE